MPLSASETLSGLITSPLSHTYVTSTCGASWDCWGGKTGGSVVCQGTGSSIEADCIAGSKGRAGIVYWVTGLCHQTANRILWPAKTQLPDHIPEVLASYAVFEEYGHDLPGFETWDQLRTRCAGPPSSGQVSGSSQAPGSGGPARGAASSYEVEFSHGSRLSMTSFTSSAEFPPDRRAKLVALIRRKLDRRVDAKTIDGLVEMQTTLQARQRHLAKLVISHEITREKYIEDLDAAMKLASEVGKGLLGPQDFHKLYGEFRVHGLGDPKEFIAEAPSTQRL